MGPHEGNVIAQFARKYWNGILDKGEYFYWRGFLGLGTEVYVPARADVVNEERLKAIAGEVFGVETDKINVTPYKTDKMTHRVVSIPVDSLNLQELWDRKPQTHPNFNKPSDLIERLEQEAQAVR